MDCRKFVDGMKKQYISDKSRRRVVLYMRLYKAKRALSDFVQLDEYAKEQQEYEDACQRFQDQTYFCLRGGLDQNQRNVHSLKMPRLPPAVLKAKELEKFVAELEKSMGEIESVVE